MSLTEEFGSGENAGRRILVVDDHRDSAEALGKLLEIAGHRVTLAHDGKTAVERAQALEPDVVILDIGLPVLDGNQAARQIRAQPNGGRILLVALTGWGREEDQRRSESVGFDLHIVKPVDMPTLDRLLAAIQTAARTTQT